MRQFDQLEALRGERPPMDDPRWLEEEETAEADDDEEEEDEDEDDEDDDEEDEDEEDEDLEPPVVREPWASAHTISLV